MDDFDWRELEHIRRLAAPPDIYEDDPKNWDELIAMFQKLRESGQTFSPEEVSFVVVDADLFKKFVEHYEETVEAANKAIRKANRWREESLKRNPKIKPLECRYHGALAEIAKLKAEVEQANRIADERVRMVKMGFAAALAHREGGAE